MKFLKTTYLDLDFVALPKNLLSRNDFHFQDLCKRLGTKNRRCNGWMLPCKLQTWVACWGTIIFTLLSDFWKPRLKELLLGKILPTLVSQQTDGCVILRSRKFGKSKDNNCSKHRSHILRYWPQFKYIAMCVVAKNILRVCLKLYSLSLEVLTLPNSYGSLFSGGQFDELTTKAWKKKGGWGEDLQWLIRSGKRTTTHKLNPLSGLKKYVTAKLYFFFCFAILVYFDSNSERTRLFYWALLVLTVG